MAGINRTNRQWLDELEDVIDGLNQRRGEMRRQVYDADYEADDLWSDTERRWRRLETKLHKAEKAAAAPLNSPRARNVDRLIARIDEAYYELERLLD